RPGGRRPDAFFFRHRPLSAGNPAANPKGRSFRAQRRLQYLAAKRMAGDIRALGRAGGVRRADLLLPRAMAGVLLAGGRHFLGPSLQYSAPGKMPGGRDGARPGAAGPAGDFSRTPAAMGGAILFWRGKAAGVP